MSGETPVRYDAEQAGKIVGRSAYWMKAQARAGKIPHTRVGRSYAWTPAHLNEFLRAGEKKPRPALVPSTPAAKRSAGGGQAPVLQARTPRRKRDSGTAKVA